MQTPFIPLVRGNYQSIALDGVVCSTGNAVLAPRLVAVGRLFFKEAGHQFDQVARFVGAVQLVDDDLVPSIFTGPGGTR